MHSVARLSPGRHPHLRISVHAGRRNGREWNEHGRAGVTTEEARRHDLHAEEGRGGASGVLHNWGQG